MIAIDERVRSIAWDYDQECKRWREGLRAIWEHHRQEEEAYWRRMGLREDEARERASANAAKRAAARERFASSRAGQWRRTLPNGPTPRQIIRELLFRLESRVAMQLVRLAAALTVEAFKAALEAAREHNRAHPPLPLPPDDAENLENWRPFARKFN